MKAIQTQKPNAIPLQPADPGCTPVSAHPGASPAYLPWHKHTWDAQGCIKSEHCCPVSKVAVTHPQPQKHCQHTQAMRQPRLLHSPV